MPAGNHALCTRKYRACIVLASAIIGVQLYAPAAAQNLRAGSPNFPTLLSGAYGQQDPDRRGSRPFTIVPAITGQLLFSDNIDLQSDDEKESDWVLSLILLVAMTVNLVIAGVAGGFVPLILERLGFDPAVASSIFVTTFTDVGGFFSFLGLATLALHFLR